MYHPHPGGPAEAALAQPAPVPVCRPASEPAAPEPDTGRAGPWPLPRSGEACALARRAVRHTLSRWGLGDLADTAELLVSELVANALRHAHGPVHLTLVRGRSVCCQVGDGSRELPRVRRATADDEDGRGMSMVDLMACDWGADRTPWGKEVWFSLPAPAPALPAPALPATAVPAPAPPADERD